jgi:hypothetical protein
MKNEIRLLSAGAVVAAGLALGVRGVPAQEPGEQSVPRGQFAGMQRVGGEVTGVNGSTLTVKTEEGTTMQIVTTDNTRVMKGRGVTVKVSELKVGDGVVAAGNLHAAMVFATDAAQLKALRDNLGKTYITGKVTAIDLDNAKMTLERPDHVVQTIGFDETTSFKRGRGMRGGVMGMGAGAGPADSAGADSGESITLADIKVGDNVGGQGSVKNGTFVPTQLMVSTPGQGGRRRSGTGTVPGGAAGAGPTNN